jgi:hypothetical protein
VLAEKEPEVTVMRVDPEVKAVANPWETEATEGFEEVHVALRVMFVVAPKASTIEAVNCIVLPRRSDGVNGVRTIDGEFPG